MCPGRSLRLWIFDGKRALNARSLRSPSAMTGGTGALGLCSTLPKG